MNISNFDIIKYYLKFNIFNFNINEYILFIFFLMFHEMERYESANIKN